MLSESLVNGSTFNSQLTHDVVTTLGYACILVATSNYVNTTLSQRYVSDVVILQPKINVVTTLCFRRRFSDLVLTLQQRRDSDVVFLTKI